MKIDITANNVKNEGAQTAQTEATVKETVVNNEKEYSLACMTKGMREVLLKTRTLSQSLKVFGGIMNVTITAGKTEMTIREWFEACDVPVGKNGRLSPKAVLGAWKMKDELGMPQVWRNCPVRLNTEDKTDNSTRIYCYNAEDKEYQPLSVFKLVTIEENKWSADVILKGLLQGAFKAHFEEKETKSRKEYEDVKKVYRFNKRTEKGTVMNKAIESKKENCVF